MEKIGYVLKLMRPKQWIKNFFVFGALLFSNSFLNFNAIMKSIMVFIVFSLASSTVYVLNDIVDIEKDRAHPKKCKRPLASGKLKIYEALIAGLLIGMIAIGISLKINISVTIVIILYFLNNIIYSFKVKNIVLLDVCSIAIGFVLRVIAGSLAISVPVSGWIILCTFFISLFLGLGKRKGEIKLLKNDAKSHRKILSDYNNSSLDKLINMVLTCTVVFYSIYTVVGAENEYMIFTVIFVIYGIFRYTYLMEVKDITSSPTEVLISDKPLMINIVLWVITCMFVLV